MGSFLIIFDIQIHTYIVMKRIIALTLVAGLIIVGSCKKLKSVADIKFQVPYKETAEVPGLPNNPFIPAEGLTVSLPAIEVESQSEEYLKQYNTSSEFIREVRTTDLRLTIEQPASQNFDIVDSLWLLVSATGRPEILAAHKYGIPKGQNVVNLDLVDNDMKEYFLADKMYFRLMGHFYDAPDTTTKLNFFVNFEIVANPLYK